MVYAADAFAVTPLTTDVETILALLPVLDSELMPAQGTRADRAVALAFELFANAGDQRGDVLLVSDGLGEIELERIDALHRDACNPGTACRCSRWAPPRADRSRSKTAVF